MTSVEALWTVRFGAEGTPVDDLEGGVAMFESGRIFGGDAGFAYIGNFELKDGRFTGALRILRHHPEWRSLYGMMEDAFELSFAGTLVTEDEIVAKLMRPGFPDAKLLLRRLAPLP
jgi:hypothetical protein